MKSPKPPTIARPSRTPPPLTAPAPPPAHTRAELLAAQSSAARSHRQQAAEHDRSDAEAVRDGDRRHAERMRSIKP